MRAIILCAGKGTRLKPWTNFKPKPLFKVNNIPLVENNISFLLKNNINDIVIVTGYMNDEFNYLTKKYSNINIIINKDYNKYNNYYSLLLAQKYFDDDILILSGDIYIKDNFLISKYLYDKSIVFSHKNITNSIEYEVLFNSNNKKLINIDINSKNGYCMNNITFLKKEILPSFLEELNNVTDCNEYYEDVLTRLIYKHDIFVETIDNDIVIEIDSIKDAFKMGLITKMRAIHQLLCNMMKYYYKKVFNKFTNNQKKL